MLYGHLINEGYEMGLDITAMSQIENKGLALEDGHGYEYGLLYKNPHFPRQFDGLESGVTYICKGKEHRFYAGSYSGYNSWRNILSEMAGYPLTEFKNVAGIAGKSYQAGVFDCDGGPFAELIAFSNCEGVIGPKTSAKLYADFVSHQEKAEDIGGRFLEIYNNFRDAFNLASYNGCVEFH